MTAIEELNALFEHLSVLRIRYAGAESSEVCMSELRPVILEIKRIVGGYVESFVPKDKREEVVRAREIRNKISEEPAMIAGTEIPKDSAAYVRWLYDIADKCTQICNAVDIRNLDAASIYTELMDEDGEPLALKKGL